MVDKSSNLVTGEGDYLISEVSLLLIFIAWIQ